MDAAAQPVKPVPEYLRIRGWSSPRHARQDPSVPLLARHNVAGTGRRVNAKPDADFSATNQPAEHGE